MNIEQGPRANQVIISKTAFNLVQSVSKVIEFVVESTELVTESELPETCLIDAACADVTRKL